jgi:hypothetical protein
MVNGDVLIPCAPFQANNLMVRVLNTKNQLLPFNLPALRPHGMSPTSLL